MDPSAGRVPCFSVSVDQIPNRLELCGKVEVANTAASVRVPGCHGSVRCVVDSVTLQDGRAIARPPRNVFLDSLIVQGFPQCPRLTGEGSASVGVKVGALAVHRILPEAVPMASGIPTSGLEAPRGRGGNGDGDGSGSGGSGHESVAFDPHRFPYLPRQRKGF